MSKLTVVFDLETTGTNLTKDRIVSIAATKIDVATGEVGEIKHMLINPMMKIPAEATAVHGITDAMVEMKPTFASYAKALYDYLLGCDLGGFNIRKFDIPLLSEEFSRVNITWPAGGELVFDAYKIFALKEKRDLEGAVKFYCNEQIVGAHDTASDVKSSVGVFLAQLKRYPDLADMSAEALDEFCREGRVYADLDGKIEILPNGDAVYAFGKDQGKVIRDNPGFAVWMLKNDFSSSTKKYIRDVLKIRG